MHVLCAALLHLQGIEASVTADIEYGGPGQIFGDGLGNVLPFDVGEIAKEMMRGSRNAVQIKIMKPLPKFCDAVRQSNFAGGRTGWNGGWRDLQWIGQWGHKNVRSKDAGSELPVAPGPMFLPRGPKGRFQPRRRQPQLRKAHQSASCPNRRPKRP